MVSLAELRRSVGWEGKTRHHITKWVRPEFAASESNSSSAGFPQNKLLWKASEGASSLRRWKCVGMWEDKGWRDKS